LKNEQIELQKSLAILKALPEIVANAVKPLENIEGIKILQGYGASGSGDGVMSSTGNNGGIAEQVTSAALNYRANAPLVDSLLRELGLVNKDSGSLQDLVTGNHSILGHQDMTDLAPAELAMSEAQLNGTPLAKDDDKTDTVKPAKS
jgi:flotillin